MSIDVFAVAQTLVDHLIAAAGDDVDVVVYYGSQVKGTATPGSDLDLFYIPAEGARRQPCFTVLVADRTFDLYPISWSRATRIANFDEPLTGIVADGRMVYARDDATRTRFAALQRRPIELRASEYARDMLERAMRIFKDATYDAYVLESAACIDDAAFRFTAWSMAMRILHCLAALNRTYMRHAPGKDMAEIMAWPRRPAKLDELIAALSASPGRAGTLTACRTMLAETRAALLAEQRALSSGDDFGDVFQDSYPEIREQLVKIERACARRDLVLASAAVAQVQHEVALFLAWADGRVASDFNAFSEYRAAYDAASLPDLSAPAASGDFERLRDAAREFDRAFRSLLTGRGVALNEYATLDELRNALTAVG